MVGMLGDWDRVEAGMGLKMPSGYGGLVIGERPLNETARGRSRRN